MAIERIWITATPSGRTLAQPVIDLAGLGGQISIESWTPYPSAEDAKLYWVGGNMEASILLALELAVLSVVGTRTRRGPVRPSSPALTRAQVQATYPIPNIGPPAGTVVSKKAALWLHYRDFGLGPFDDDGSPGIVATGRSVAEPVEE